MQICPTQAVLLSEIQTLLHVHGSVVAIGGLRVYGGHGYCVAGGNLPRRASRESSMFGLLSRDFGKQVVRANWNKRIPRWTARLDPPEEGIFGCVEHFLSAFCTRGTELLSVGRFRLHQNMQTCRFNIALKTHDMGRPL